MLLEDRLWKTDRGAIAGVIYGALPNKSNSRKIGAIGRGSSARPILMKDPKAMTFGKRFAAVVMIYQGALGRDLPLVGATSMKDLSKGRKLLSLTATVHGNFERDLDVELLPDLLQANGLINNDRAIRRKHYDWRPDTINPRVEFEIGFLE
jgi:hypothetical protein